LARKNKKFVFVISSMGGQSPPLGWQKTIASDSRGPLNMVARGRLSQTVANDGLSRAVVDNQWER